MKYIVYYGTGQPPRFMENVAGKISQIGTHPDIPGVSVGLVDDGNKDVTDVFVEFPILPAPYREIEAMSRLLFLWREGAAPATPPALLALLRHWCILLEVAENFLHGNDIQSMASIICKQNGLGFQLSINGL